MSQSTERTNAAGIALIFSLLLHMAMIATFVYLTKFGGEKLVAKDEPIFVDLQDSPKMNVPETFRKDQESKRAAETSQRVPVEKAPKGYDFHDYGRKPIPDIQAGRPDARAKSSEPERATVKKGQQQDFSPHDEIFRKKEPQSYDVAKLYPKQRDISKIEEIYRKKYGEEIKEDEVKQLNTQEFMFASFMRRLENRIYGVWRYPRELAMQGKEGTLLVTATFNRKGDVIRVDLMESSGHKELDDLAIKALNSIGPLGNLPKAYPNEKLLLPISFTYYIIDGKSQRTIR